MFLALGSFECFCFVFFSVLWCLFSVLLKLLNNGAKLMVYIRRTCKLTICSVIFVVWRHCLSSTSLSSLSSVKWLWWRYNTRIVYCCGMPLRVDFCDECVLYMDEAGTAESGTLRRPEQPRQAASALPSVERSHYAGVLPPGWLGTTAGTRH